MLCHEIGRFIANIMQAIMVLLCDGRTICWYVYVTFRDIRQTQKLYLTIYTNLDRLSDSWDPTPQSPHASSEIAAEQTSLSKFYFALLLVYICFLWTAKAALLFYYSSIT